LLVDVVVTGSQIASVTEELKRQNAASVKAISPTTPVLMLTGWGRRLLAQNEIPPHVDRVLGKPPRLDDIRAALAELTAAAQPAS